MTAKAKPAKLLCVVSDLHCGSRVGLCPPGIHDAEGGEITLNPLQRWLWKCWTHATQEWLPAVTGGQPYECVVNGDLIEGIHHGGKQVIGEDIGLHIDAAKGSLEKLSPSRWHVVIGTECHTANAEYGVGKALKASVDAATGKHAHSHLRLEFAGKLVSATHHCSATSRVWLESGEFSRAMNNERLQCLRSGWRAPDVVIRGHRHVSGYYTDHVSAMLITGAWQAATRHLHKAVPTAIPMPTMSVLDFRHVGDGDLPAVHTARYRPDEPQAVR